MNSNRIGVRVAPVYPGDRTGDIVSCNEIVGVTEVKTTTYATRLHDINFYKLENGSGWIHDYDHEHSHRKMIEWVEDSTPNNIWWRCCCGQGVSHRIREAPDLQAKQIGLLQHGEEFEVIGRSPGWVQHARGWSIIYIEGNDKISLQCMRQRKVPVEYSSYRIHPHTSETAHMLLRAKCIQHPSDCVTTALLIA